MADRDALIVICWLVILILVFFECFHRKLKARFGGDIRPPQNTHQSLTSFPSDTLVVGGPSSRPDSRFGGNFVRSGLHGPTLGNNMSINRGARFSPPITITTSTSGDSPSYTCGSTKEVCRIPMMSLMMAYDSVEDEEPPPTYEEAVSYAKLMSKLQSTPYGDKSVVVQCDDGSVKGVGGRDTHNNNNNNDGDNNCNGSGVISNNNNATNAIPTTSTSLTTTTAIFVSEEESDDDEESDDSSSSQSANDSDEDDQGQLDTDSNNNNDDDSSESNSKRVDIIQRSGEVQCNMNVIVTSSSSKNLDRIEIECEEKIKISTDGSNISEKKNLQFVSPPSSIPPKLLPPPTSLPGSIV